MREIKWRVETDTAELRRVVGLGTRLYWSSAGSLWVCFADSRVDIQRICLFVNKGTAALTPEEKQAIENMARLRYAELLAEGP